MMRLVMFGLAAWALATGPTFGDGERAVVSGAFSSKIDPKTLEWLNAGQARRDEQVKAVKAAAKVKFTKEAPGGGTNYPHPIFLEKGTLWVIQTHDKQKQEYIVYFDDKLSWEIERDELVKHLEKRPLPDNDEEAAKSLKSEIDYLKKSKSQIGYQYGNYSIRLLQERTGSVPDKVQKYFDQLVKEAKDTQEALLDSYLPLVKNPDDKALQVALIDAYTSYLMKSQTHHSVMSPNKHYPVPEDQWLFDRDQLDIIRRGELTTASISEMGGNATWMLSARPVGKKQYVSITVSGQSLKDIASRVEETAQEFYHNHRLRLKLGEGVGDEVPKGKIEGKSAEELFKSLAQRCGVKIVRDDKDENVWILKP